MALGRGLESLLKDSSYNNSAENQLVNLDINLVKPNPDQPRKHFDESSIKELAESIKNYGIIEPIIVKRDGEFYIIIAGERRWRALMSLKEETIPVIIKNQDVDILELSIIENLQREDLNPIELAQGYELLLKEYNYTQEALADKLGIKRSSLTNTLRLLKLPAELQDMVKEGKLSFGKARALLSVEDSELQEKLAREIVEKDLSVRSTENLIKRTAKKTRPQKSQSDNDFFADDICKKLSQKYDTKVEIKQNNSKGKITFSFGSLDQLQSILGLLGFNDDII